MKFAAGYVAGVGTVIGLIALWLVYAVATYGQRCAVRAGPIGSDKWNTCVAHHAPFREHD